MKHLQKGVALLLAAMMALSFAPTALAMIVDDGTTCPSDPYGTGWHNWMYVSGQEANCQHGWIETWRCEYCGKTYTSEYGEKGNHVFGDYQTINPTCTQEGGTRRTCRLCGYVEELWEIAPLGHDYQPDRKAPTCTQEGYERLVCSRCGATAREVVLQATGHDWDYGQITNDATCTASGTLTYTCRNCGATRTETIPAYGHDPMWKEGYPATCTENGKTDGQVCGACGIVIEAQTVIPALGHDWGDWFTYINPTCTDPGQDVRYCSRCQARQTRDIAATGHVWSQSAVTQEPTCTIPGVRTWYCYNTIGAVHTKEESIAALGHDWSEWKTEGGATCTEPGMRYRTCARCNLWEKEDLPAQNHTWGSWKVEIPGTCVQKEMNVRTCSRCGLEEYRYGDYGPHDWGEWQTIIEPTATEPGIEMRFCKLNPDHVEEREIPALTREETHPALTLEWLYDAASDKTPYDTDTFGPDDSVFAMHTVTNTGDVPLNIQLHCSSPAEGETDMGDQKALEPGGSFSQGAGAMILQSMLDPGTETEALLGTVTYTIWYSGLDPKTGEELCATDKITRVWKVIQSTDGTPTEEKAELTVTVLTKDGNPPYAEKTEFQSGEKYWFHTFIENTGNVDVELYDCDKSMYGVAATTGYNIGSRYLLHPGETVDNWDGYYLAGMTGWISEGDEAPGTETETLAGTCTYSVTVYGYKPGTDEVICTGEGSATIGLLKEDGAPAEDQYVLAGVEDHSTGWRREESSGYREGVAYWLNKNGALKMTWAGAEPEKGAVGAGSSRLYVDSGGAKDLTEDPVPGKTYYFVITVYNNNKDDHSVDYSQIDPSQVILTADGFEVAYLGFTERLVSGEEDGAALTFALTYLGGETPADDGPHPALFEEDSWAADAGEGKRYVGAKVDFTVKLTNTGDCTVFVPLSWSEVSAPHAAEEQGYRLEPGESLSWVLTSFVTGKDVENGFFYDNGNCYALYEQDGVWKYVYSNSVEDKIPLTYPEGETPTPPTGDPDSTPDKDKGGNPIVEPHPALLLEVSWAPDAGEGKRYVGAEVYYQVKETNTGDCALYLTFGGPPSITDLVTPRSEEEDGYRVEPGESIAFTRMDKMITPDVDAGAFIYDGAIAFADYFDQNGNKQWIVSNEVDINIPLTSPEGEPPAPPTGDPDGNPDTDLTGKPIVEPQPDISVVVTADADAGEGKRYEGAVVPFYITITNTGDCTVYVTDGWPSSYEHISTPHGTMSIEETIAAALAPGESMVMLHHCKVYASNVEAGSVTDYASIAYHYYDKDHKFTYRSASSNKCTVDLTYPEGGEPEAPKPELTLTVTQNEPEKEAYTYTDEHVDGNYLTNNVTVTNTGNVPLNFQLLFCRDDTGFVSHTGFKTGMTLAPGESWNRPAFWYYVMNKYMTPDPEDSPYAGTATCHFEVEGYDVETGETVCVSNSVSFTHKIAKPGPSEWEIPSLSDMAAEVKVSAGYESSDPAGYQLGEKYGTHLITENTGEVAIPAGTIHVYDPYDGWTDTYYGHDFEPGERITGCSGCWNWGTVTEEDVARGYIYFPPVEFTWEDPDSGETMPATSNSLTLPVITKTGLLVQKSVGNAPAEGGYFQAGETIQWKLTVTNTSEEPIKNITVKDQGVVVGTFGRIDPGETRECTVPGHEVTEYDEWVGTVTNQAVAQGTDLKGVEHTWFGNIATAPTSQKGADEHPLPPTGDPEKGKTGDPDGVPDPGDTPGGGEDPGGSIYGVKVSTSIYKTTAHGPKNDEYYELNETVDYTITIKNTGDTTLENVKVTDSLHGLEPIETIPTLAPGEEKTVSFSYTVTQHDVDEVGYVVNQADVSYTFLGGKPGTPQQSNKVYVIAGENGGIPGGGVPGDGDGTPGGGTSTIPGDGSGDFCAMTLTALGGGEIHYSLHACAGHTEAAKAAEAASAEEAVRIWRAEIDKLYQELYDAAQAEAKAVVMNDRAVFWAYVDAYEALYGDEALASLLRLRCAELCCMSHTAPDALPDSILGSYATIMGGGQYDACERAFTALDGSDCQIIVRLNKELARTMEDAITTVRGAKSYAVDQAFVQVQAQWQMALDSATNAAYKAADKETRKAIVACRKLLDQVIAARTELLNVIYPNSPEIIQEAIANLYRDAALDASKAK